MQSFTFSLFFFHLFQLLCQLFCLVVSELFFTNTRYHGLSFLTQEGKEPKRVHQTARRRKRGFDADTGAAAAAALCLQVNFFSIILLINCIRKNMKIGRGTRSTGGSNVPVFVLYEL